MLDPLEWKEISRETVFRDPYGREIEKVVFELPNGEVSDYYVRKVQASAVVLALTPEREVILARQYRPGKGRVLLELPGGGIEPGQTPEDAARDELRQETGYEGRLEFVAACLPDGYSNWVSHCFVATDCVRVAEPRLDPQEFIEVVLMPLGQFLNHARSGQFTDVDAAMLGLDRLGLL